MKKSIVQLVGCCLIVLVSCRQVIGSSVVSSSTSSSSPASPSTSKSLPSDLGLSESRSYSSSSYDNSREADSYGKRGNGYESSEDQSDEYKSQPKKTVILAIPVKLALQQQKQQESYQSQQQPSYGDRDRGNSYDQEPPRSSYQQQSNPQQESSRGSSSYGSEGGSYEQYPNQRDSYRGDRSERNEYRESTASYRPSRERDSYQREPQYNAPQPQYQSSSRYHSSSSNDRYQPTYNDKAASKPSYEEEESDSQSGGQYTGNAQSYDKSPKYETVEPTQYDSHEDAPVVVHKSKKPKKQQVTYQYEDVSGDEYPGSGLTESSYSGSSSASYPSSSSSSSMKESSKYTLPDGETINLESFGDSLPSNYGSGSESSYSSSNSYPGSLSSSSSLSELKGYDGESMSPASAGLGEEDYSALSALSSQMNPYPSLSGSVPQSELSFLLNKMPRGGFSPIPAVSSHSSPYPLASFASMRPSFAGGFGYPRTSASFRPRPVYPSYASSPYMKSSYPGSSYAASSASKMYMPAASSPYKSYASPPYPAYPSYGSGSSSSSSFPSFSGAKIGGITVGKGFAGKGLRIGPLEIGAPSGSFPLFPTIKIKAPARAA